MFRKLRCFDGSEFLPMSEYSSHLIRNKSRLNEIVREINIKILFFYTLFPDILRENPLDSNEKYASDDADFIFISIPLGEAIEFLFDEIYVQK